ncbi:MAG TPA: zinc-ribbon domain-containing protein, partial [Casimicrobiaceae bacterium]
MFCANCGRLVADGMKFCPHCGTPVAAVAAPAVSPAARA